MSNYPFLVPVDLNIVADISPENMKFKAVSWSAARGYHLVDVFSMSSSGTSAGTSLIQVTLSTNVKMIVSANTVFPLLRYRRGDQRVSEGCVLASSLKSGDSLIGCSQDLLTRTNAVEVKVVKAKTTKLSSDRPMYMFNSTGNVPVGHQGVLVYPY